jgi:uncharacterized protein (DUF1330 family)
VASRLDSPLLDRDAERRRLEFPTAARAREWDNSAGYHSLVADRRRASRGGNVILVEGV